ncbi:hypothetical protein Droror1_Dr00002256, partial [Drosera rotundifolia]
MFCGCLISGVRLGFLYSWLNWGIRLRLLKPFLDSIRINLLCSFWQENLKDLAFHPFKIVENNGKVE